MATDKGIALVDRDEDGVDRAFREDVLAGLHHDPKAIPARWFYDAEGSRLFEKITQVEEYYPTRSETEILGARGPEFAELIGPGRAVVEFGSGSSVKTPLLLEAIDPAAYVPLDISGDFLRESAAALGAKFPGLPVQWIRWASSASSPGRRSATWSRARQSTCCGRCARRWARTKAPARCC